MASSSDSENNTATINPKSIKQESTSNNSKGTVNLPSHFIQETQTTLKRKYDHLEEDEASDCSTTAETEAEPSQFPGLGVEHLDQEDANGVDPEMSQISDSVRLPLEEVLNRKQNDESDNNLHELRLKNFFQIAKILKDKIDLTQLQAHGPLGKRILIKLVSLLEEKRHSSVQSLRRTLDKPHPKTREEIMNILKGPAYIDGSINSLEEDKHPWGTPAFITLTKQKQEKIYFQGAKAHRHSQGTSASRRQALSSLDTITITTFPGMLLRAWDDISVCRIRDISEGFLAGSHYEFLNKEELRKSALKNHANWGNRHKTPFISVTTDIDEIADYRVPHFEERQKKRGHTSVTKVTLINGLASRDSNLPLLKMTTELEYYKLMLPLDKVRDGGSRRFDINKRSFFANEYLFLFQIPPEQIVGTWLWKDIAKWMETNHTKDIQQWYQKVATPAFEEHEIARKTGSAANLHGPQCTCCGH